MTVIEVAAFDEPKTKRMAAMLEALGIRGPCLIAVAGHDPVFHKSSRNIPRLSVAPVKNLNALEILEHDRLVLTREVVEALGDILAAAPGTGKARSGRSGRGAKARAEGTPR